MGWVVQLPWTEDNAEDHRVDALRLLRQVPAIVDIALVDGAGIERLHISRIGRDVIGSGLDRSGDPAVLGARQARIWYGPVTLNRGSEPYMALSIAGNRSAVGVAVAQINLKFIWDVISAIRVGKAGLAFVVDGNGRLVAHPDIGLVLQGADESTAAHLRALQAAMHAAGGEPVTTADVEGRTVLAAMAPIAGVDWMVFAEQPISEAYAPIRAALWRTGFLAMDTLFLTHFGPWGGARLHFQQLFERLDAWSAVVKRLLADASLDDAAREQTFVEEALQDIRRSVGETEAEHYSRAGRLDYSWQGLARYWRRAVR